jgi:hypothetical protein
MSERYIADPVRGLIPADQFYADKYARQFAAQSGLSAPHVIGDTMPETEHPCDGKVYTSKSAMARVTKAHGCIEMGNDPQRFRVPKRVNPNRDEIRASLRRAKSRLA